MCASASRSIIHACTHFICCEWRVRSPFSFASPAAALLSHSQMHTYTHALSLSFCVCVCVTVSSDRQKQAKWADSCLLPSPSPTHSIWHEKRKRATLDLLVLPSLCLPSLPVHLTLLPEQLCRRSLLVMHSHTLSVTAAVEAAAAASFNRAFV